MWCGGINCTATYEGTSESQWTCFAERPQYHSKQNSSAVYHKLKAVRWRARLVLRFWMNSQFHACLQPGAQGDVVQLVPQGVGSLDPPFNKEELVMPFKLGCVRV